MILHNMTNFYHSVTYSFSLKPAVPLILEHIGLGFVKSKEVTYNGHAITKKD